MRYAIFTDVHANLEALEAVLAKIDELAQQEPVDQIWFLGDLVGYGPNPNECIVKLRERTDVIIAGNHDWAAVGKIDLDDFSEAARISAEWTAEQLTEEHREFLANLPERLEIGDCTLVHGSPYGPLWEYLTSEVLAERSFQYFNSRFCLVGHTHVPIIFQQPDNAANAPTIPLEAGEQSAPVSDLQGGEDEPEHPNNGTLDSDDDDETVEMVAVRPTRQTMQTTTSSESPHADTASSPGGAVSAEDAEANEQAQAAEGEPAADSSSAEPSHTKDEATPTAEREEADSAGEQGADVAHDDALAASAEEVEAEVHAASPEEEQEPGEQDDFTGETSSEEIIVNAEDRLNQEIEELLALLGLSQSMIQVTNEMIVPPEGLWQPADGHRAIINPGGVGQPRDGDPRAAFMIYDTERGFTFYRIGYDIEKTQEKIIKAGLPHYLATRLAFGR
jgi:diadenosine tetraphosphatase ApaH/serine/threonine PP2A family protein phosphatase